MSHQCWTPVTFLDPKPTRPAIDIPSPDATRVYTDQMVYVTCRQTMVIKPYLVLLSDPMSLSTFTDRVQPDIWPDRTPAFIASTLPCILTALASGATDSIFSKKISDNLAWPATPPDLQRLLISDLWHDPTRPNSVSHQIIRKPSRVICSGSARVVRGSADAASHHRRQNGEASLVAVAVRHPVGQWTQPMRMRRHLPDVGGHCRALQVRLVDITAAADPGFF